MLATRIETAAAYLDSLTPLQVRVGYGQLGLNGSLGYEGKRVSVQRKSYAHSLSCHPPSEVLYHVGGRYSSFRAEVALNDDVLHSTSHADFILLADGVQVGAVNYVQPGAAPRSLAADIRGAQLLTLVVQTSRWESCHAVWLDPCLESTDAAPAPSTLLDCLHRAEISLPASPPRASQCICTVVSPGFEALADDMLASLCANGDCSDALLVVFMLGKSSECIRVAAKHKAFLVPCQSRSAINPMSKALMYSAARVIDADRYIFLDADMVVLSSLQPVFAALQACPDGSILAVREGNGTGHFTLRQAFFDVYGGAERDFHRLVTAADAEYPLIVNDGIFAAGRSAMLALDGLIRSFQGAGEWIDQRRDIWWRNQFIFNLALSRLQCGVELDGSFNVQLHAQDVDISHTAVGMQAQWRGKPVRILHLSGAGRRKYPEWQGLFSRVPDPLAGRGDPNSFPQFLTALRQWVGRYGLSALAWSFYGTTDARDGRVRDCGVFPLFALLHYLVRSNGCARVLETGTARGVSAACLASAVAHRRDAAIVSFDPYPHPESEDLWAMLPPNISSCIEARQVDSLEGMRQAIGDGERYEAALLDSIHTAEHVWAEFQLATQLVCSGGLILIHDARYTGGTVPLALQQIEQAGYNVVRLWCASAGTAEDDGLGLAVIENDLRGSDARYITMQHQETQPS
jgi:NPCBM/NEW2 domain/Methyltransferase domain